jgi:hypothetical protein
LTGNSPVVESKTVIDDYFLGEASQWRISKAMHYRSGWPLEWPA